MKHYDYIIVGQGIAGSCLGFQLQLLGKKIIFIDKEDKNISSQIAAGLYNPIVFKRLNKSWLADDLIPYLNSFYPKIEEFIDAKILYKNEMIKLFIDAEQENDWYAKSEDSRFSKYLGGQENIKFPEWLKHHSFSYAKVTESGYVDTSAFLNGIRRKFDVINESLNFNDLKVTDKIIEYKNISAENMIFCEGYLAKNNPYFNYLPFSLTKGEVLEIKLKEYKKIEHVFSKGFFIKPLKENIYKVGATFNWKDKTTKPTKEGKNQLIEKLATIGILENDFEIINHLAGIRPTVTDRRPTIGTHPIFKNLHIFNGLGTKGIMIAPFFSQQFANNLLEKLPLHPEVDIKRFNGKHEYIV